ncbi:DUF4230 domain-containing protein [Priestia flexa]|uniref:DUF4230 domain-containing protein n=1 Tax=Priestia flexa TaxID=86664 RepID=UPI00047419F2|nr:DUF4230 domain-containing protein [Priestia flexa]
MTWKFKQLLIKALIAIVASFILVTTTIHAVNTHQSDEEVKIVQQHEEIADQSYIISKETVMSKLDSTVKVVSMKEDINKKLEDVDKGFLGERVTELKLHGTYMMGLHTKEIKILHIDNEQGILYLKLGEPKLISLDIPFDQLEFDKTQGFMRLALDEEEQKNFYKASKKRIEKELLGNEEIMQKANMYNQKAIEKLFSDIPNIKEIKFK